MRPPSWLLLFAVAVFVLFLLVKARLPRRSVDPAKELARRKIAEAKKRAQSRDPKERAQAFRDAAAAALDGLNRPSLAASYALRADRADPHDPESVRALALALRRANRYRALERMLWRRLASTDGSAYDRSFAELVDLYDGPLRRSEWAAALRRLRGGAGS